MNKASSIVVAAALAAAWPVSSLATDYTWTGAAGGTWGEGGNWSPTGTPSAPADTASFSGAANATVDLDGIQRTIGSLTFASTVAADFTLSNGAIALSHQGSIVKANASTAYTHTIAANLALAGDATVLNNDGPMAIQHPAGDRRLIISGGVSGGGTLRLGGSSTSGIELSGNNAAFTGIIHIDGGLVVVSSANALGSAAGGTIVNGGQIWFRSSGSTAENWTIAGDSQWRSYNGHTQSGTITVNENVTWNINNGGGNHLRLNGVIGGSGSIHFEYANTEFAGSQSNTLTGRIIHAANSEASDSYNTLYLNKSGSATAIAGDLELSNRAIVEWNRDHQVADTSGITLLGGTLNLNGHSDTVGTLTIGGKASIALPGTGNSIRFADSSSRAWASGQVIIREWSGAGSDNVYIGASATGLTSAQLARVGFMNPADREAGLYRAVIGPDGQLMPAASKVEAINPAFDLSAAAVAARTALYTSDGRARLTGADTPLAANSTISFFGDSITWLNGYVSRIDQAVQNGPGTTGKGIKLLNRGINGGGVLSVLNGSATNTFNNQPQAGFADVLAADGSDVAVVFIGINDVRFLGTGADVFEAGLRDIAAAADAQGTKLVLATLSVSYEKPDGTNPHDTQIEQFAQITRNVAADTGAILVDLRKAYIAYLQNHNYELQLDGTMTFQSQGLLTNDGLHPTTLGQNLLADLIAQGIHDAVALPEPSALALLTLGPVCAGRRRRANS